MAKGFTVKAKAPAKPKAAEQEWDYDKAREMLKGKTVVFCLPGRAVSYTYLKNFVQLCFDLVQCGACLLYTSPSPRDVEESRMPSSA